MKSAIALAVLSLALLGSFVPTASAQTVNVYAGYLNNLSPFDPAAFPAPFDPSANTILISSGDSTTAHDTGVIRFQNLCNKPVTIDPGVKVVTQGAVFQIWDGNLPIVLNPGQNLVLAETANFNFDSSDFGLGINPIVSGSVDGMTFSFADVGRILLGHEEAANGPETTPYGLLGSINCVPEPGTLALLCAGMTGLLVTGRRRRR